MSNESKSNVQFREYYWANGKLFYWPAEDGHSFVEVKENSDELKEDK
jgi:hypothetical protein